MGLLAENKHIINTEHVNKKLQKMIDNNYIIKSVSIRGLESLHFNNRVLCIGCNIIIGYHNKGKVVYRKYTIHHCNDNTLVTKDLDGLVYHFSIELFKSTSYEIFDLF